MNNKKFDYFIEGEKNKWEVIIGLEVHAQVLSQSKLFSSSSTKFGAEPNTQVSLVDSAFPGMLPVINQYCVEQSIKTGLGLKAKINLHSVFDRKNYFYADLPQGYQISQYKNPIVGEGEVVLDMPYGVKKIGIERLHLEQDAGKSIHDLDPDNTYVDLFLLLNQARFLCFVLCRIDLLQEAFQEKLNLINLLVNLVLLQILLGMKKKVLI